MARDHVRGDWNFRPYVGEDGTVVWICIHDPVLWSRDCYSEQIIFPNRVWAGSIASPV